MELRHRLAGLTWQEATARLRERPVGLLPLGAIEAHGPHLPLDTDLIIAEAMAAAGARALADHAVPCLILPSVSFGVSFVGTCFPGTSPVTANGLEGYLGALLDGLAPQGYRAVCLCNAHLEPAHVAALRAAATAAQARTGLPVAVLDAREPRWSARLGEEFQRGARHAGSYETSIVLAAQPQAVDTARLRTLPPVWVDLPARLQAGARTFVEAGGALGYFGDPARATIAEGEQLIAALGAIVAELVGEIFESPGTRDSPP